MPVFKRSMRRTSPGSQGNLRTVISAGTAAGLVAMIAFSGVDPALAANDNPLLDLIPSSKPSVNPSKLPSLTNEDPSTLASGKYNVTVGKSVVIPTDSSGKPGSAAMFSSTQVSGNGSGTVVVPMGGEARSTTSLSQPTSDGESLTYNVNSSGDQIQNFGAQTTSYKGSLPIAITVKATLDGKEIDPADLVNVTGMVNVAYTFSNTTVEDTKISFKNPDGNVITETAPIAVPFAGSFSVTLPSQFGDVNAPWAAGGQSPAGLLLGGTVEMIPPLGKLTQTLSFTARAENATLPKASFTAAPVVLSNQAIGRLAMEYGPMAEKGVEKVYGYGNSAEGMVARVKLLLVKYGSLIEGYAAKADKIANAVVSGAYDDEVKKGTVGLIELDDGVKQLNQLLPAATKVIGAVDKAVDTGTALIENNLDSINKAAANLETLIELIEKYGDEAKGVADLVLQLVTKENLDTLDLVLGLGASECSEWAATNKTGPDGEGGISLAKSTLSDGLDQLSDGPAKDNASDLLDTLGALTLVNTGQFEKCAAGAKDLSALLEKNEEAIIKGAASLQNFIDNQLPKYVKQLTAVNVKVQAAVANEADLLKKLDNPCNPAKKLKPCGIKQKIDYLNKNMNLATVQVDKKMLPGTDKLASYVPIINKYFDLVKNEYAPEADKYLREVPGAVDKFAEYLGIADVVASDVTKYSGQAETYLAKLIATMEVMDKRAAAGEGIPAGPATGANTNLGAYQYQIAPAANNQRTNIILFSVTALLVLIGAGFGTLMYRRHRP
jgi:hypothetical protein